MARANRRFIQTNNVNQYPGDSPAATARRDRSGTENRAAFCVWGERPYHALVENA